MWALGQKGQLGGPRTSSKVKDTLIRLPVAYRPPLVAAGFTEAKHGALCIDGTHSLQQLYACVAAKLQPVHLCLVVDMLLHSIHTCIYMVLRYQSQDLRGMCEPASAKKEQCAFISLQVKPLISWPNG